MFDLVDIMTIRDPATGATSTFVFGNGEPSTEYIDKGVDYYCDSTSGKFYKASTTTVFLVKRWDAFMAKLYFYTSDLLCEMSSDTWVTKLFHYAGRNLYCAGSKRFRIKKGFQ